MRLVLLSDLHIGMHRADLVQPLPFLFQLLHNADTLLIVLEMAAYFLQRLFPHMAEGRMSQVMSKCDRFYKIFIQSQCLRYCSGNL